MTLDAVGEFLGALAQLGVLPLRPPQLHEGAHYQDVHRDGAGTVQDAREHRHAFLGEGAWNGPAASAAASV